VYLYGWDRGCSESEKGISVDGKCAETAAEIQVRSNIGMRGLTVRTSEEEVERNNVATSPTSSTTPSKDSAAPTPMLDRRPPGIPSFNETDTQHLLHFYIAL
jgi:hypothetical protein